MRLRRPIVPLVLRVPRALRRHATRSLALLVLAPSALAAQYAEVGAFSAWVPSVGGSNLPLWGGSLGGSGAGIGVRLSGGLRRASTSPSSVDPAATPPSSAFMVDMDLVYDTRDNAALAPLASALFGFSPAVFAGFGAMGRRDEGEPTKAVPVFSYGGGVSRPLFGGLGLMTEARWRSAVRGAGGELPEGFRNGWEYRAGVSLRIGGRGSGGSGGGGGIPGLPFPLPGGGGRSTGASARASEVIDTADDYVGVPYVYGGSTPRGFDCSGFLQYVFNRHGVRLPRTSRQQALVGRAVPVSIAALRPGDLIAFNTEGQRIDHIAMYVGRNRILHSSSSGGGVRHDDLGSRRGQWFASKMVAVRRVVDDRGNSFIDEQSLQRLLREMVTQLDTPDRAPRP